MLSSYAAPFNEGGNDINNEHVANNSNSIQRKRERNKTMKKREPTKNVNNPKLDAMMKRIHDSEEYANEDDDDNDDGNQLSNFEPISPPHIQSNDESGVPNAPDYSDNSREAQQENFTQMPTEYAKQYYQQYVPYHNQGSDDVRPNGANKDELLNKLNQIIYLLEEQQGERTNNVSEELILYSFLGIFIIFIVDSFARVGKYVR
tara:strand:+ start:6196 stop:6807 length:612 start_codon:yes stop_codon:yes gene_type:complete